MSDIVALNLDAEDIFSLGTAKPDPTEDPDYFDCDHEEACANATKAGFTVVKGDARTLLLDLDTEADVEFMKQMMPMVTEDLNVIDIQQWRSKSGVGSHVKILLEKELPVLERLLLQACLGSDRKKELHALRRVHEGDTHPSVLFQPKNAEIII